MERKLIRAAFVFVKTAFFPRWDKNESWRVQYSKTRKCQGRADDEAKTIIYGSGDPVLVLAHEICHAVTNGGHGKKWIARYEKVAVRASRIGMAELSKQIREEIEQYRGRPREDLATCIYEDIEDIILNSYETPTYKSVVGWVAWKNGTTRRELEKKYKRCRAAYEKGVKMRDKLLSRGIIAQRPEEDRDEELVADGDV
jgi:hypothetical protein